jgi:glycerol-3-phosphate dehydrogenase (NAD(P)+)
MGGWGTALASLLAAAGRETVLWGRDAAKAARLAETRENAEYLPGVSIPGGLSVTSDLGAAVSGAETVICAVPSRGFRAAVRAFAPYVAGGALVVSASKGFEEDTLKRLSIVAAEELPKARIACLSGPGHAEEVARGGPTAYVAASPVVADAEFLQELLSGPAFRVYANTDITGVELGGALKNVVALATGMSDGMGYGDNARAALMTRGIAEIARLGVALGAKPETFSGLSGIGDLIVTCASMHSRNRRAGILLGQGVPLAEALAAVHSTVEGVVTARSALTLAREHGVETPIISAVCGVAFGGRPPRDMVDSLMNRDRKREGW